VEVVLALAVKWWQYLLLPLAQSLPPNETNQPQQTFQCRCLHHWMLCCKIVIQIQTYQLKHKITFFSHHSDISISILAENYQPWKQYHEVIKVLCHLYFWSTLNKKTSILSLSHVPKKDYQEIKKSNAVWPIPHNNNARVYSMDNWQNFHPFHCLSFVRNWVIPVKISQEPRILIYCSYAYSILSYYAYLAIVQDNH
jgi:hypothetical protein